MATRKITINLDSPAFKELMIEAFEKAGRITIQCMTELAENNAERAIVERLGAAYLAKLED